jgi:hypothetical protein
VQRPQGQHDDLARLPRARSRQGSHRRSSTSRNGSRPSLRHASRVVAAASGARTSPAVARDSNRVSAGHERRRQETGFRGPETKAPKRSPKSNGSFAETERRQHAPPNRGRSPLAGKSLRTRGCVVVCAVKYEPVSTHKFPIIREFNREFGPFGPLSASPEMKFQNKVKYLCRNSLCNVIGNYEQLIGNSRNRNGF